MKTIIVGVDGSKASGAALDMAANEAALHGAQLRVVVVWHVPASAYTVGGGMPLFDDGSLDALRDEAQRVAEGAVTRVRQIAPGLDCAAEVLDGQPAERLLQSSADADLIVVGSRGLGGFKRLMLGSVSDQVVHHASCPVLVVHSGTDAR
jgi:nucleotide-binding universal stress UspA family protein